MKPSHLLAVLAAVGATLPGIACHLLGIPLTPPLTALVSGLAILGASFMLLWACDAAQADISQTLALAVVALIAVLPEYAVDMYFTWQAGQDTASAYAHYAVANMTGANRLLIGVAWGAIALLSWMRFRRTVRLGPERRTELLFLAIATGYAFLIPLKGTLAWYDGIVFLALYAWYIALAARRPAEEAEAFGPAAAIVRLGRRARRAATLGLFLFAGGVILLHAESFCEGLIGTGRTFGINEFLLVQWLAPIASESPEFIVALMFAWRGQSSLALGSLLSSKLNQWTLLVGMIPGVFAVSHGTLAHPIPMGATQMSEIFLTAAQSLLGVVLLASMRLTLGASALLFGLFAGQLLLPSLVSRSGIPALGLNPQYIHPLFTLLYLTAASAVFFARPGQMVRLRRGFDIVVRRPAEPECSCDLEGLPDQVTGGAEAANESGHGASLPDLPRCASCQWKVAALAAGLKPTPPGRPARGGSSPQS